ncbi:hypothetical protein ACQ4PT_017026 [Festuca glaucescens]
MVMILLSFFSSTRGRRSMLSEDDMERELKMLNKPYVISFKDNSGVVFDCVDIYKQPAFDHPLLKDHKLQVRLAVRITSQPSSSTGLASTGGSCPNGTVPIRRTLKEDLVRESARSPVYKQTKDTSTVDGLHFARVLFNSNDGTPFQGASAVVEVYQLAFPPDAASLAQIIVVDDRPTNATAVQTGWHIDTYLEGDSQTRFMVFWTVDNYQETGCANMLCPGFVLMNQGLTPGMALPTGTTVTMDIERDESGNWLVFLNTELVGYFPGPIVNGMSSGTQVQMGGSVYSPPSLNTSPPMGSGVSPLPGPYNGAAKFTQVSCHGPKGITYRTTKDVANSTIYNAMVTSTSPDGPEGVAFQYGGPGGS